MKNRLDHDMVIPASRCDATSCIGIPDCFAAFMDLATEHAEQLGIGLGLLDSDGLFWLTAKTKIHFYRRPRMNEPVTFSTWPELPERFSCNRDYSITKDGELLVAGKTQWAMMNTRTGRLQAMEGVFPAELTMAEDRVLPEPFARVKGDFPEEPFGEVRVRSIDIDLGGHMNNAAYVREFAGLFSTKEWQALDIHELEIHYRKSCYEGDILQFRMHDAGAEKHVKASLPDGTDIVYLILR